MLYEIKEDGLADFTIRFRAIADLKENIQESIQKAAELAADEMRRNVPYHEGRLYRAIEVDTEGGPFGTGYQPGGAGGGGHYTARVFVDQDEAPHAAWVIGGTGIYDRSGPHGIYPANGNVMAFDKLGEGAVFTRWTRGQQPQDRWVEAAREIAAQSLRQDIQQI